MLLTMIDKIQYQLISDQHMVKFYINKILNI